MAGKDLFLSCVGYCYFGVWEELKAACECAMLIWLLVLGESLIQKGDGSGGSKEESRRGCE